MSSKDKAKQFQDKLKNFFKFKRDAPSRSKDDFVFTPEMQQELNKDNPLAIRMKAIKELPEIIGKCKLQEHDISKLTNGHLSLGPKTEVTPLLMVPVEARDTDTDY